MATDTDPAPTTIYVAGISTEPYDPLAGDLFATNKREIAFAWLAGSLIEYEGADPYITDVHKAMAEGLDGIVVWFQSLDAVEESVKAFCGPVHYVEV